MAINVETAKALAELNDGVDHFQLDWEAEHSAARLTGYDPRSNSAKFSLSVLKEPLGQASVRVLDSGGTKTYGLAADQVKNVSIETLDVDPGRYHLGMLAAAQATIKAYPGVERIVVNPDLEAAFTIEGVALHISGWQHAQTPHEWNGQIKVGPALTRTPTRAN